MPLYILCSYFWAHTAPPRDDSKAYAFGFVGSLSGSCSCIHVSGVYRDEIGLYRGYMRVIYI